MIKTTKIKIPTDLTIGEVKKWIKRNRPHLYESIGRDEAIRARKEYRKQNNKVRERLRKITFKEAKIQHNYPHNLIIEMYGNYRRAKRTLEQLQTMWNIGFDTAWEMCQAKHGKEKEMFL